METDRRGQKVRLNFLTLLSFLLFVLRPGSLNAQIDMKTSMGGDVQKVAPISVTIGGSFPVNGTFPAFPSERVDQFVTRIYSTVKEQLLARLERLPPTSPSAQLTLQATPQAAEQAAQTTAQTTVRNPGDYPQRNIRLRRISGEEIVLDLQKFRLTGDFRDNPYLKNDDVLIFPAVDNERDFVSISGAVKQIARFQFVEGDRLADAVLFAGGVNSAYERVDTAAISRLDGSGQRESLLTVSVRENPPLSRGDRIVLVAPENEKRDFRILVMGEVCRPGSVPITKNTTTLREVMRKVGGFKPGADRRRTELIRGGKVFQSLFYTENLEMLLMSRSANLLPADTLGFAIDEKVRALRGNGMIDFENIDSTAEGDFIVRDGDLMTVPEQQNVVYVFGQVTSPGYVAFSPGQSSQYYLSKVGGAAETARDEIYLIKGKTRTWKRLKSNDDAAIEAGDFLWVPKEPRRELDFYLTRIASAAQILGGIATIILLLKQF